MSLKTYASAAPLVILFAALSGAAADELAMAMHDNVGEWARTQIKSQMTSGAARGQSVTQTEVIDRMIQERSPELERVTERLNRYERELQNQLTSQRPKYDQYTETLQRYNSQPAYQGGRSGQDLVQLGILEHDLSSRKFGLEKTMSAIARAQSRLAVMVQEMSGLISHSQHGKEGRLERLSRVTRALVERYSALENFSNLKGEQLANKMFEETRAQRLLRPPSTYEPLDTASRRLPLGTDNGIQRVDLSVKQNVEIQTRSGIHVDGRVTGFQNGNLIVEVAPGDHRAVEFKDINQIRTNGQRVARGAATDQQIVEAIRLNHLRTPRTREVTETRPSAAPQNASEAFGTQAIREGRRLPGPMGGAPTIY